MSSKEIVIELKNVWKKYSKELICHRSIREDIVNIFKQKTDLIVSEFWALKNINLKVYKGEIIGLFGPNSAGKSTILKLISQVIYPTQGDILTSGRIAPLLELGAGFHPDLTGEENVFVNGAILGMTISEIKNRLEKIVEFSEIGDFINMPVKKYSSGMYLRLAFSIAIHSEADIYLFDEAISVGDESFQEKCLNSIKKLCSQENKTVIFVSHNRNILDAIADRIVKIEKGEIL